MISAALAILETDGQRNELSEFYKKNKRRLSAFSFSRLHNREAAEDALQEAFLNTVKYPKTFFDLEDHKKVSFALLIIKHVIPRMLKDSIFLKYQMVINYTKMTQPYILYVQYINSKIER